MPRFNPFPLFLLFFLLPAFHSHAQTEWLPFDRIYDDEYVTVDIQFSPSDNSCEDEGRLWKYRLKLTGRYRTYPVYLCWRMSYIDCNANLFYQDVNADLWKPGGGKIDSFLLIESIDSRFQAKDLVQSFYNITISKTKKFASGLMDASYSMDPQKIDSLSSKGVTQLTVYGKYLGADAQWIWHKNKCNGKVIGIGKTIEVRPDETTTYYVRAEAPDYKTNCVRITVPGIGKPVIPAVVIHSTIPSGISAPPFLCRGDTAKLRIENGRLGKNSEWFWYAGADKKMIGTGESIFVMPLKKTVYYARAEGEFDTTAFVSYELNVYEKSEETFSIIHKGKPFICPGEHVDLEIDNFVPNDDGKWHWYQDSCNGPLIDSEVVVTVHPLKTTTYFLRRDGICNPSNCTSVTIFVNEKTDVKNAFIIIPDTVYRWKKASLKVGGATISKGAEWEWYKGVVSPETYIGTGDSITLKFWRKGKYFVKAKGPCSESDIVSAVVRPKKSPTRKYLIIKIPWF
jgi:hypothetical protein